MADNLKFPIYFDLDGAVSQASKDWNDNYADKLEKSLGKRPVKVKLSFDLKNIDKLDDVKKRIEGIKITPITKENQQVLKDLVKDLRELAKALKGLIDESKLGFDEDGAFIGFDEQLDAVRSENPWLFEVPGAGAVKHGAGTESMDGVTKAFLERNEGLEL